MIRDYVVYFIPLVKKSPLMSPKKLQPTMTLLHDLITGNTLLATPSENVHIAKGCSQKMSLLILMRNVKKNPMNRDRRGFRGVGRLPL